jgi:hypothetical protein
MNREEFVNELISTKNFLIRQKYFQKNFFLEYTTDESNLMVNIDNLLKSIDITLKSECRHEYEEDDIDITLDESRHICYCKICLCTFQYPYPTNK